jgi:hypothetical protein
MNTKKHIHNYISTWQGWVCSRCNKAKTGKTLTPDTETNKKYAKSLGHALHESTEFTPICNLGWDRNLQVYRKLRRGEKTRGLIIR